MRTIAIINQKGGVGKTTSSVNLAAGLVRQGKRTLLIDLDPQAHATLSVGLDPDTFEGPTMSDALLAEGASVSDVMIPTYLEGLMLAPATLALSKADSLLHTRHFREQRLKHALESLKSFDYAIIDCQPTLGVLPVNAIVAADHFLIPVQPSGYALRGLGDLLETLHSIRRLIPGWDYRILLTMVNAQATVTNQLVERILEPLQAKLMASRIGRCEALNRSPMQEHPRDILSFAPQSRAATDYQNLTQEILRLWPSH